MAKVNAGRMEMDTDVARTSGSSMAAAGEQKAKSAADIVQRINANEYSIGTGADAANFHAKYDATAASVKNAVPAAGTMLTDLGNSLTEAAAAYEEVDRQHRQAMDRIGRA
jgi:uncharacterized protein YukE